MHKRHRSAKICQTAAYLACTNTSRMRLQKNRLSLIITLCILLQVSVLVEGLYQLKVTVFGYNNPTGRCQDCPLHDGTRACCDRFLTTDCDGFDQCDSFFVYCLRTIGRTGRGCSYFGNQTSNFNTNDDGSINFSLNRVLGLENPIILQGLTNTYVGVQLHIEVMDDDSESRAMDPDNPDELIDVLLIDHDLPIGQPSPRQNYDGIYDYVMMDLSITARCVRNFQGPDCSQCLPGFAGMMCNVRINECNCSGHGQCFDGVPSLTCNCDPGFTGVECEVNIDDCMDVNCSGNGHCVDGINSFTCICNASFTGPLCESTQINARDSEDSIVTPIVGGVLGLLVIVIIILLITVVVAVTKCRSISLSSPTSTKEEDIEMKPNSLYGLTSGSESIVIKPNKVYGVSLPAEPSHIETYDYVNPAT